MAPWKLYVFGPPRLEHAGHPVELHLRKALALTAYLAVTDQPQSRDTLATLFWPDSSQRQARASLRRTLYRLTHALGEGVLLSSETVQLNPHAGLWLDYQAFLEHAAAARDGVSDAERLAHLAEAAGLYSDDFLAGFTLKDSPAFDEWQFFQREGLRQAFAQVLVQLVAIHRGQELFVPAVAYARRWLALDPLREPAHRALIELYALAGQQAAALRQYGECVRILDEELGVPPEEETTALFEAVRARRILPLLEPGASRELPAERRHDRSGAALELAAAASRSAAPGAGVEASAGASPPVGREVELRRLHERLERALGGARQLVFVSGEAGIGKTTLVDTFLEEIRSNPALRIGQGQCLEHRGTGEAYMPLLESLERMCQGDPGLIELLARRAPTWLIQMPWLTDEEELTSLQNRVIGATRERMLREMVETLGVLAAERPLVLALEDLHWSDYSTLDLITALARRQEPARLMLIGTFRPTDAHAHPLHAVIQELRARGYASELELTFLSEAAVRAYLEARMPGAAFLEELATLVHQRTEGNPLFMVNLVDSWLAKGMLVHSAGQWTLRVGLDELAVGLPESLRHLIELQLEQLDPLDQTILEAASVAGMAFSAAAVAAGADLSEEAVEVRCAALARQGRFLRALGAVAWPDGTVAAHCGFIHHLSGEVLYEGITASRRARLHRQIGARLEAGYGARAQEVEVAAELAVHFVRGGEQEQAVHYLRLAAQQALQRSAHRDAIRHLASGLELLQSQPDTPERARAELALQAMLAPALIAVDGWGSPQAEEAYARAYALCERLGDSPQRSQVMFGLAAMLEMRAEYQKSQALMEARLSLPGGSQSGDWSLESHDLLACSLFHQGAFHRALEQAEQGLALYDHEQQHALIATLGDDPGVDCHIWAALSLWFLGYPDRALKRIHVALELAQSHLYSLANARVQAAFIHQCRREEEVTLKWAEAAIALATAQGFPYRVTVGTTLRGWAKAVQGEHEEGIAQLHEGLAACREAGILLDYPYFLALLAEAYGPSGQIDEGLAALAEAQAMVQSSRAFFYEAELHRLRGSLLLQANQGNAAEAEACFLQALETSRWQGAKSLELRAATSLAALWRGQGKIAEARRLLGEVYGWFSEGFDSADLQEARALLAELGGEVGHKPRPSGGASPLPAQPTPFVGRDRELGELQGLLADEGCRLVTILGPGGIGKTRLALKAAATMTAAFFHGVYFAPLAPLHAADHLVPALAEHLGLHFYQAGEPKAQLLDYLREKELLLVLDNFEHLLDGTGLIAEMLLAAPRLKVLVTSRERLDLSGEAVYSLGGMAFPEREGGQHALEYGAVQLLMQSARLARPNLEPRAFDLEAILRICSLVQGMPLAIVLAAGWLEVLSFGEIADEIARSLDVLEGHARDLPERQKSVRATFDYSWSRLAPQDQQVFMKLSVFRGGFTRRAAETVTGASLWTLRTLVNRSFLSASQEGRYEIHELLHQYAEEKLEASGEAEESRDAHGAYYLNALAGREAALHGSGQVAALAQIEADLENIRAAWRWALARQNEDTIGRAVESLYLFFSMRSRYLEGAEMLRLACENLTMAATDASNLALARVLARLVFLRSLAEPLDDDLEADLERSLTLAEAAGAKADIAFSLLMLGSLHTLRMRDHDLALGFLERSLSHYRELEDDFYLAGVLHWLGECHGSATGLDLFKSYTRQSLDIARKSGNLFSIALDLLNLVPVALCSGEYAAAEAYCQESLQANEALDLRLGTVIARAWLALVKLLQGDMDDAAKQAEEALRLATETSYAPSRACALAVLGLRAGLADDFETAARLGEESLAMTGYVVESTLAHWCLAVADLGLKRFEPALGHVREALEQARSRAYPAIMTWLLPVAAAILASGGEGAVELLALASSHPLSATGWLERWPRLTALQEELEAELGAEAYQAAWERGKALDVEAVAAALSSNVGTSSDQEA